MKINNISLSAHQPAYLPWLGYFEKIAAVDVFIFLDSVQFEKNSYINRNKIKTPTGSQWLSLPVSSRGHFSQTLKETVIENREFWVNKHLKSIYSNYRKSYYFDYCYPRLENLFSNSDLKLSDFCFRQLNFWLSELGIDTKVVRSSTLDLQSKKSDLIIDLCNVHGANSYYSGCLGRQYIDEGSFTSSNILIKYQNYIPIKYPQLWGDFVPNLSVVDLWMNCGPDSRDIFMGDV
ncbi:WbqC family protein [Deefgea piscis]|uniref:WbqC family protein n=1 Tax=Deefgea piscis TaxID=2739061 RepID=A0A6M8SWC9_9NEIS|nr:WbqC family protein [Deefgea piscis]QKJ67896.1 WbqC family protein [Deefgea piscis]